MGVDQAAEVCREALFVSLVLGGPVMIIAVVVGLAISVFQAVTQLNEQTLTIVPKIIVMGLLTFAMLPWLLEYLMEYTVELYRGIPAGMGG